MKEYQIAVIGCGMISHSHIPAIASLPNAKLAAVCDIIPEKAQTAGREAGVPFYTDAATMLKAEKNIDICLIATPTYTHPELVELCASHGRAVLCEKPIAVGRRGAEAIRDSVRRYQVPYMTAQVVRFWCGYVKLKEMVQNGEFGEIYMSYLSRCSEPQHWGNDWLYTPELGGGGMYDMLVHDVDFLEYLYGPAKKVYSLASRDETGCYNNVFSSIEYEGGQKAVAETAFTMSTGYPFSMYAKIMGSKATAEFHYCAGYSINDRGGATCTLDLWREGQKPEHIEVEQYNAYAAEISYFISCIEAGKAPEVVTPEDSINVMASINAMEISADNGRPVLVSEITDRVISQK